MNETVVTKREYSILSCRDSNIPLIRRRDMTSINIYCSVWTHVSIFDGQSWYCWFCVGGFYLFIWDLGRCFAALRALFGFTSRWQRNCSSFSLPWEQSKALIQVRKAISTAPLVRRPFAAHISVVLRWNRSCLLTLLLIECLAATFQGSLLFRSHLSRLRKPICLV